MNNKPTLGKGFFDLGSQVFLKLKGTNQIDLCKHFVRSVFFFRVIGAQSGRQVFKLSIAGGSINYPPKYF